MPPKDRPSRRSSTSGSSRSEGQTRRPSSVRQLITFVDSQDPNSRSAIQRHTAHHSNAQRRNARLQSLRSTRPRLLEWQRRPSAETDALVVTSPQGSTSSTSLSPAPGLHAPLSAPGDISTELSNAPTASPERMTPSSQSAAPGGPAVDVSVLNDSMIERYLLHICPFAQKDTYRDVVDYIRNTCQCEASACLLSAYVLACRGAMSSDGPTESDLNDAQRLYGRATRLLGNRLTNPQTASSDGNIQAVLLLIAYAADTGSAEEVPIHFGALSRMIKERGGLSAFEEQIDSTLKMQVRAISHSRRHHLTLGCTPGCPYESRFPGEIGFFDTQNET